MCGRRRSPLERGAQRAGCVHHGRLPEPSVRPNTPRRFAPPLSRGDHERWPDRMSSPLERGARRAGCVGEADQLSVRCCRPAPRRGAFSCRAFACEGPRMITGSRALPGPAPARALQGSHVAVVVRPLAPAARPPPAASPPLLRFNPRQGGQRSARPTVFRFQLSAFTFQLSASSFPLARRKFSIPRGEITLRTIARVVREKFFAARAKKFSPLKIRSGAKNFASRKYL